MKRPAHLQLAPVTLLAGGAAILALLVLYRRSAATDPEAYTSVMGNIQRLRALDAHQNELVLQTRFGFARNYDDLVHSLDDSSELLATLDPNETRLGAAPEASARRLASARQSFLDKRQLIERFKTRNAVLGNATRYFPVALGHALAAQSDVLSSAELERLVVDSVRFAFDGGQELAGQVVGVADLIEGTPADGVELAAMVGHTRKIGAARLESDQLVQSILDNPTADELEALGRQVHYDYGLEVRRAERSRHALYVLATALLAYGIWMVSRLRRAQGNLREVNATLELRIGERTRELNERNAALSHEVARRAAVEETLRVRNRDLDEFTYVASHDLQEPLRKLQSFSQLLERDLGDDLPPAAAEDLSYIIDAASRMQRLVQDLLALSRTGKQAMRVELLRPAECVRDALSALALSLDETEARIELGDLPDVWADRTMLTQLFQNLIGNAVKFTREAERPTVRVQAEVGETEVTIRVSDEGIGLKSEYAEKIFAPFKRLHGRETYAGTGIGLSICARTVERHGGRIWVESEPGTGSTFSFCLPNERPEEFSDDDDDTAATSYRLAG